MFSRFDVKTELILATMPAAMIIAVLSLLEFFSKQHLLFSSLASSAFLIYLDPRHPTNSIRTLCIAQVSAALIGYFIYLLLGSGYLSAAISMGLVTLFMILTKAMHPPAVSSAMVFAFQVTQPDTVLLFLSAVVLLVILIILQRFSLWVIQKFEGKSVDKKTLLKDRQ